MAGVVQKFFVTSIIMWMAPVAILYGFNHSWFPVASNLSSYHVTLVSGFLAVISVNVVIAFYIYMAMKEPSHKHEPDSAFLNEAKASIKKLTAETAASSSQSRQKEE